MKLLAAGILLSLALAGPGQAAVDCKTSPGNPACSAPQAARPGLAAKASLGSNTEPKPRPEPQAVGRASPSGANKQAAAKKPRQHPVPQRTARHSAPHRNFAQRSWRQESRQAWKAHSEARDGYGREYRPPSGPVYESGPSAMSGGCDDACQYRAWFQQYSAWYERYGRAYGAGRGGSGTNYYSGQSAGGQSAGGQSTGGQSAGLAPGDNGRPARLQGRNGPDQSERDRLDPWHGYNGRDGLGNGY
jgi:hypothetical protein